MSTETETAVNNNADEWVVVGGVTGGSNLPDNENVKRLRPVLSAGWYERSGVEAVCESLFGLVMA